MTVELVDRVTTERALRANELVSKLAHAVCPSSPTSTPRPRGEFLSIDRHVRFHAQEARIFRAPALIRSQGGRE